MRDDEQIERDVEAELQWHPDLDDAHIAVAVRDGIVMLGGFVRSYNDRWEAERSAKRVDGVLAVANDLEVRLPGADERPDPEIAHDAVAALKARLRYSYEEIKVIVRDGWVTLEGEVELHYQREAAEHAVRRIPGVKGISNQITLKPQAPPSEIRRKVERPSGAARPSTPIGSPSRSTGQR